MTATAKVFSTGNSQAVRLPKAFRVNVSEMWISKNDATGEITLRPVASESSIDRLFRLIEEVPLRAGFLSNASRRNEVPHNPFGDETDGTSAPAPARAVKRSNSVRSKSAGGKSRRGNSARGKTVRSARA